MNLNEELKTILRCKKLLSEAYSVGRGEEIEFIRNGRKGSVAKFSKRN
ncbi:hypothetical protein NPM06_24030 [Bacillus cereus]|nr:hypothetical protein [Bacillus cereus]HDR4949083.1 hypothetical protein [Bacillus cereus]